MGLLQQKVAFYFLTPITGLALAALLLSEPFGLRDALGLVAVAIGIALINRTTRPGSFMAARRR